MTSEKYPSDEEILSRLANSCTGLSKAALEYRRVITNTGDYSFAKANAIHKNLISELKNVVGCLRYCGVDIPDMVRELNYDKLTINMTRYELIVDGKTIETPLKELELLFYLASNPNRVFKREQLLDSVWGFEYYGDSRTVDVHIKRLRKKLRGVSDKWSLKTVWGVGYKFEVEEKKGEEF